MPVIKMDGAKDVLARIDILEDFADYAFGKGTPEYNYFINGASGLPGFPAIIKPDCPLTLNKLYAIFKAGYDVEGSFVKNAINDVFYKFKDTLVLAVFLSTLIVLIVILVLAYKAKMVSILFSVIVVVAFIVVGLLLLFWYNPKLTDIIGQSAKTTFAPAPSPPGPPNSWTLAQIEKIALDLEAKYGPLYASYFAAFAQIKLQTLNANCS